MAVPSGVVAVAYSGGRDSTALLHATLRSAAAGTAVVALHVHHGLQPQAEDWLAHCEATCRRWADAGARLTFAAIRLEGRPPRGASTEAWARVERYRALRSLALAHGARVVLLGQHRRDQAETFLLQALRGGGPAGLAAMPRLAGRAGIVWARPWLDRPREAIEAYVAEHRLAYVDDASNADPRHARNRLRLAVWPSLEAAFPHAEAALAGAAARAEEARAALTELAAIDLARVFEPSGLVLAAWRALSPARRGNVLRAWLAEVTGRAPSNALVRRLLDEADRRGAARWPLDDGELRRHRGHLAFVANAAGCAGPSAIGTVDLSGLGLHRLPGWPGAIEVTAAVSQGIAPHRLRALRIAARGGGERFRLGPGRPARSLKKQYQACGIAPWQREGPLLWSDKELLFVPGLGCDAGAWATPGEPQRALRWRPDAAGAPDDGR